MYEGKAQKAHDLTMFLLNHMDIKNMSPEKLVDIYAETYASIFHFLPDLYPYPYVKKEVD